MVRAEGWKRRCGELHADSSLRHVPGHAMRGTMEAPARGLAVIAEEALTYVCDFLERIEPAPGSDTVI